MRNSRRQFTPILPQSLARWFGRNLAPNFKPRNLLRIFVLYPRRWLLHHFLSIRHSIEIYASSFLRFSKKSFCRKPIRVGILHRVVAVVLSVSLLANNTPVLRRFYCVSHATAKPREYWLATDAFSISFDKVFLIPKVVYTALRRREHRRATDAFLTT